MIEKIETILTLGAFLVYALIVTVLFIVSKIRGRKSKRQDTNYVEQLLTELPNIWCEVENKFKTCFGTQKTGIFKLDSALSILRDKCEGYGIKYDRSFWEAQINNLTLVSKQNGVSETVQDLDKNKIQGVTYEG